MKNKKAQDLADKILKKFWMTMNEQSKKICQIINQRFFIWR
jgi:hypothetical protein